MIPDLTKYLLLFKRLCIPHVGSFEIIQQAPVYNVVDKQISPPQYTVRHLPHEHISDHQLDFIAAAENTNTGAVLEELNALGNRIRKLAEQNSFTWIGIGMLRFRGGRMDFTNQLTAIDGLNTVAAEKVLRQNVEHSRLVGDRQTSATVTNYTGGSGWWALPVKWGWIILGIAILVIIFFLFKNHFSPTSGGLKLKFF